MTKKIFAIIMVIALILSSFTLAFANNSDENKEKKDKTGNRKIHVHLETELEDITKVEVIINGDTFELEANGNSGNYTISKGGDLVSNKLTKIIVHTSTGEVEFEPADDEQQGQEGQGSINYRITGTESDNESIDEEGDIVEVVIIEGDGGTGETVTGGGNEGTEEEPEEDVETEDIESGGDNTAIESTPGDTTPDSTKSIVNTDNTITIAPDETPLGIAEPQKISSTEETPVETEIKTETIDLEDEETPLDIPSTGVATPFLYGAGALISLVGLLKRR